MRLRHLIKDKASNGYKGESDKLSDDPGDHSQKAICTSPEMEPARYEHNKYGAGEAVTARIPDTQALMYVSNSMRQECIMFDGSSLPDKGCPNKTTIQVWKQQGMEVVKI